ncbi:MAG TPA: tetratricopeptide repeat protein [Terriglobales bacterium]|nr:tetratricopeptide repeat protein [Terriglobales bacterium]
MQGTSQPQTANLRLDSWKEIAAFFGRDERTVKRWEKDRALPVRRYPGSGRGGVFAYTEELSSWLEGRAPRVVDSIAEVVSPQEEIQRSPDRPLLPGKRSIWLVAATVMAALALAAGLRYERGRGKTEVSAMPAAPEDAVSRRPQAEELYLEGRYYWNKRTPESLNMAVDYFTQAIVKDPNYARAYVGLADCYNLMREYSVLPDSEAYPRATEAARRAVELDDNSAEAHASLAFVTFYGNWDAPDAERHFQRALALNPSYANAHHWYATFLMTQGRFPEALGEIGRAQQLDPASPAIVADKGLILLLAGQTDSAVELLKQLEASDPEFLSPHRYLAEFYLSSRRGRDFLAEAEKAAALSHDDAAIGVVKAGERGFAGGGERAMLQSMLQEQKKLLAENRIAPYQLARTCALLGARQDALGYLQRAYQGRNSDLISLRNDATLRGLRTDASFRELVIKVGLPALN